MINQTDLHKRVTELAKQDGLAKDHPMIIAAEEFSRAATGFFAEIQTVSAKQFLGAFARARKAWSDYTGEPLLDLVKQ